MGITGRRDACAPALHDGVAVLCYHGVCERADIGDADAQTVQLPVDAFVAQLDHLGRTHEFISLDRLAGLLRRGGALGAPKAAVTFDDGYRNVLTVAEPLLRERGVPFAVFVNTRHVATGEWMPTDLLRAALYFTPRTSVRLASLDRTYGLGNRAARRDAVREVTARLKQAPMTLVRQLLREVRGLIAQRDWPAVEARLAANALLDWHGVQDLRRAGAVIGSHGHDHAILHERQTPAEIRYQLTASRRALTARIGACRYLAYPNGGPRDVSPAAARYAGTCGYELAFAAVPSLVTADAERTQLPRIIAPRTVAELDLRLVTARGAVARPPAARHDRLNGDGAIRGAMGPVHGDAVVGGHAAAAARGSATSSGAPTS